MKFKVGDKVMYKFTREVGEIVAIYDIAMAYDVKFPDRVESIYEEDLDEQVRK